MNEKIKTKVVVAFPATGKSYACENNPACIDSDSSKFHWKMVIEEGHPARKVNQDFPKNYIMHIQEQLNNQYIDKIFVSSHKQVVEALEAAHIDFTIVYPDHSLLEEYIGRCILRQINGTQLFPVDKLIQNWEVWIADCVIAGMNHPSVVLNHGEHLSDYL